MVRYYFIMHMLEILQAGCTPLMLIAAQNMDITKSEGIMNSIIMQSSIDISNHPVSKNYVSSSQVLF